MAILNFQKPDKVIMIDSSEFEGKFEFRPLRTWLWTHCWERIEKSIAFFFRRICNYFSQRSKILITSFLPFLEL